MAQIDNLTLDVRENDVFLTFVARNGAAAVLNVEQLADHYEGDVREVLLAWCQDRRTRPLAEQKNRLLVQDYAD